jgi:hypothetical protein
LFIRFPAWLLAALALVLASLALQHEGTKDTKVHEENQKKLLLFFVYLRVLRAFVLNTAAILT